MKTTLNNIRRARQVQHLMTDPRSIAALDVAERFANGMATKEELAAAMDAAWDARDDARAAADVAEQAALAAWAAKDAAWAAAWEHARTNSRRMCAEIEQAETFNGIKETKE